MLSGFFMMAHIDGLNGREEMTWDFLIRKIKGFFVPLCIMNAIQFVIHCITNNVNTFSGVLKKLIHFGWELLLLQTAGMIQSPQFNQDYLLGYAWYLSAMMLALVFAYPLAKHFRKVFVNIVCPLAVLAIYAVFAQKYGSLNAGNDFTGPFMDAFLRGFAGTCLGVLCYSAYMYCGNKGGKPTKLMTALDAVCWMALPGIPLLTFFCREDYGLIMLIPVFVIVLSAMLNKTPVARFLNRIPASAAAFMSKLSLYIYLSHYSAMRLAMLLLPEGKPEAKALAAIAGTAVFSYMLYTVDKARGAKRESA